MNWHLIHYATFRTSGENKNYEYLGILGANTIKQTTIDEKNKQQQTNKKQVFYARKRWAENLEILKKTSVGSLLGTSPFGCRMGTSRVWKVDLGHVESWNWVKTMVLRSWSLTIEFCRSLPTEILNTTGCTARFWGPTRHLGVLLG